MLRKCECPTPKSRPSPTGCVARRCFISSILAKRALCRLSWLVKKAAIRFTTMLRDRKNRCVFIVHVPIVPPPLAFAQSRVQDRARVSALNKHLSPLREAPQNPVAASVLSQQPLHAHGGVARGHCAQLLSIEPAFVNAVRVYALFCS